jgi:hypothetical protein
MFTLSFPPNSAISEHKLLKVTNGPETETSHFSYALLSRFHLKTETESSLRNAVFSNKR